MGKNKKENFIFTVICCALMVLGMDAYNVILRNGFTNDFFKEVLIGFVPVFFVGLIIDWFLVGKIAKSAVVKIIKVNDPLIKRILLTSFFMVCGMCFSMSLLSSIITLGISSDFLLKFIQVLGRNFVFALPLQLIIVGPIARSIFFNLYPAH